MTASGLEGDLRWVRYLEALRAFDGVRPHFGDEEFLRDEAGGGVGGGAVRKESPEGDGCYERRGHTESGKEVAPAAKHRGFVAVAGRRRDSRAAVAAAGLWSGAV
ncbi:hypothetical protein PR202_ga02751 [Eleusine coracana subsp. coracana]|uniref:Uncharacterized protein n=1 Tax=Eleusine coracana subsp. coracana TaxID=191504 RepID=A0AAV5BMK9_ELECO|nr:hypothetical protein PR202_ga02751 [Eleusine coracana subsp. coracana]